MKDYSPDLGKYVKNTIPPRLVKKWKKAVEGVNEVMLEIAEACPTARVYLESESAELMYGPDHDGPGEEMQQQRIVDSVVMIRWGGGAW